VSQFVTTALIAAALFAGAAQAQTRSPERTRAEVIAELKAAVESGEQQAMALQMEGVGYVLPKAIDRNATLFAGKNKPGKKLAAKPEAQPAL
jgi:hypothetical protein